MFSKRARATKATKKKLGFLLFALLVCKPLVAQQARSGLSGLSFVTPIVVAGGQDSNFLVDRTNPTERLFLLSLPPSIQPLAPDTKPKLLDDQTLILTLPTVAFVNDSRRHEFIATYLPEFEMFRKNGDQNSFNQNLDASLKYSLSRTIHFTLTEAYRKSHDPSRTLDNVFLLLPRSPFRQNAASAAVDVLVSPLTAFGVTYANINSTFGQTDPFQARILDSNSHGVAFSVTRMVARNQRIRGTYSLFKTSPIDRQGTADDAVDTKRPFERPINTFTVDYRIGLSPSTIVSVSGGITHFDSGLNYVFGGTLDKRFGNFWLGAGYSHSLLFASPTLPSGAPNTLGSNGLYDVLLVRLKGQATSHVGLQIDAAASHDSSARLSTGAKNLLGRLRLDYRWTDRTVTFLSMETYQQSVNDFVRAPLSRNRFLVGIEFSIATEAERRMNKLNQDDHYVDLLDHHARRQR